jgi:hypothetical protein
MNQEDINKAVGAEVQKRMEAATDDIITKVANSLQSTDRGIAERRGEVR